MKLTQELPYNTAVAIEHWQDTAKGARVSAVIYVSRDRHKGMVIGKGGKVLKGCGHPGQAGDHGADREHPCTWSFS